MRMRSLIVAISVLVVLASHVEAYTIAIWRDGDWDSASWSADPDYYGYLTLPNMTENTAAFIQSDYATWWTPGVSVIGDWTYYPPDQFPQESFIYWYTLPADFAEWGISAGPVPLFTIEGTPWLEYTAEEYSAVIPEPSTGILTIGFLAGISLLRVRVRRARVI